MKHTKDVHRFLLTMVVIGILLSACTAQNDSTLSVAEARRVAENAGWGENVTLRFAGNTMTVQSNGLSDHEILAVYQALSIVEMSPHR